MDPITAQAPDSVLLSARAFSPRGTLPLNFGEWFEIRPTPAYGGEGSRGVFATRDIAPYTIIGEYRGRRIAPQSYRLKYRSPAERAYALTATADNAPEAGRPPPAVILGHVWNPARADSASWPRFINCVSSGDVQNTTFVSQVMGGEVLAFMRTTRPVKRGDQLLAKYHLLV